METQIESQIGNGIVFLAITIILTTAIIGLYMGYRYRMRNVEGRSTPKFTSPADNHNQPTYTPASEVELVEPTFKQIDEVFGLITVDGIEYKTFEAGEVLIYDEKKNPVICFKIDGYNNAQRTINWIKISEHVDKVDGVIFYVKHHPADINLFDNWLNTQMYGGVYAKPALKFKDLMTEIGQFNQLLASHKIRKGTGQYKITK